MADPLSVITAVITVVEATAKISSMCRKYYKSVRGSQKVVMHFLSEIQTLRTIAEQLETRLHDHDAAAALHARDDSDGDDSDSDDSDYSGYKVKKYSWDEGNPSPPSLPIIRSLMDGDGVFARCVACLQDLEKRLEGTYKAWSSQKKDQQEQQEPNGTWQQKREKVRGLAMRLVWPLKESELNESIDTIHRLCSIIQMAMGVEMVLKVDDIDRKTDAVHNTVTDIQRRQAAQTTREDMRRIAKAAAQEKARRLRQRLAICSWLDGSRKREAKNESVYKRRAPNTSSWLLESAPFAAWKTGSDARKTFWLQAIPGCGKTVLASTVIHHLGEQLQSSVAALAYFYFDASDDQMTTSDKMLRSVLAQLVEHIMVEEDGPLPEPVMRLAGKCLRSHRLGGLFTRDPVVDNTGDADFATYDIKEGDYGATPPSADEVLAALQETASGFVRRGRNIYVVIDALDECADMDVLLRVLRDGLLGRHGGKPSALSTDVEAGSGSLLLFCTSRHVPSIAEVFDTRAAFVVAADREAGQNEDINGMVRQQLEQDARLRRWRSMHDEIQEALTSRAQGMFRLAACQLDILRKCKTLRSLREALRTMPTTLSDTYKSTIMAINEDDRAYAVRALLWLAVSAQPVTVREMADILAVEMEDPDEDTTTEGCHEFIFDEEQRINDLADIPVLCTTLVQTAALPEADTDNPELRLAHHTVREYMLSKPFLTEVVGNDKSLPAFLRQITDQRALHAHVATTLLSYLLCLQDPVRSHIGVKMCAQKNVRKKGCCMTKWKLRVRDTIFNPGCLLDHQLQNRPLAGYAARQWVHHFRRSWGETSQSNTTDMDKNAALVSLAMQMLGPDHDSDEKGRASMTLSYINMFRIREDWRLAHWTTMDEFYDNRIRTVIEPLRFALDHSLDWIIPDLLRAWDKNSPHLRNTALLGRPELLRMVVAMDNGGQRPLIEAITEDNQALLAALLKHMTPAASKLDESLKCASSRNEVDGVRKLLEAGANPDSALHRAAHALNVECVKLLLPLASDKGRQSAIEDFDEYVFLWSYGLKSPKSKAKSVLALFAEYLPTAVLPVASGFAFHDLTSDILSRLLGTGNVDQMRQMLACGTFDATVPVHVDGAPDTYPLFLAVLACDADLVALFLEHGAAANAPDARRGTPLAQAACLGDIAVVRLLVEQGHASLVDTNSVYGSPVQAAVFSMCVTSPEVSKGMKNCSETGPILDYRQRCCDVLDYLLTQGADANQVAQPTDAVAPFRRCDAVYTTPLSMAALFALTNATATAAAAVLLAHGADPNLILENPGESETKMSALAAAWHNGNTPLSEDLLAAGARFDPREESQLLLTALGSENLDKVQSLLSYGVDANVCVTSFRTQATFLSFTCFNDFDASVMRLFLDAGADPNGHSHLEDEYGASYQPPLQIIAQHVSGENAREKMRMLVTEYGVDVNATADGDGDNPSQGWTALLRAASNPNPDLLLYLLEELGADPAARLAEGSSAVHVAAAHNCPACLAVLAERLDVNLRNHAGRTPLHEAAAKGAVDAVEWLLQTSGADASAKDKNGMTARDLALLYEVSGAEMDVLGMAVPPYTERYRDEDVPESTGRRTPWFAEDPEPGELLALLEEAEAKQQRGSNRKQGCSVA